MSDTRDFDPRFDPAFQRGYDGGGASAPRTVPGQARGQAQGQAPIGLPPESANPARPVAPDAAGADLPAHPEPAVSLAGNPWVRVLWVIAPVFVVGGLAGQAWAQSQLMGSYSTTSPDVFAAYIVPAVAQAICPWMVLTGLAALIGVVFLNAVRWRAAA